MYGHQDHDDEERIATSAIVKAEGRIITTKSGTKYALVGDPDPDYVKWCEANGITLDLENPIKVK